MNFSGGNAKISIDQAILSIRKVLPAPEVLHAHELGLTQQNATYPYHKIEMQTYVINQGSKSFTQENLFRRGTPKIIYAALVGNDAFNGNPRKNPYEFKHFNCNYIAMVKNGTSVPGAALTPDFAGGCYIRAYTQLLQTLEEFNAKISSTNVTVGDFANGSTIFGYNLTPDLDTGGGCQQPFEQSNIRVDLRFSQALPETVNLLIFAVSDTKLMITRDRQICYE